MNDVTFFAGDGATLKRVIPKHVHSVSFNWCHRTFQIMSPEWRAARLRMGKGHDACHWCKHEFTDGEAMALAQPKRGKNRLLCQDCAGELVPQSSAGEPGEGQ